MKLEMKEQAKDFYVKHGFTIATILKVMEGEVTRKTLYNWKEKDNWDELRRKELKESESFIDDLKELARAAIRNAKADPTARNIFAAAKAIGALKTFKDVKPIIDEVPEEEVNKPRAISEETFEKLEQELFGL